VFFTDINLYSPDGRLMATSRSQVFDAGLLGMRMNAAAYDRLSGADRTEFVHIERLGEARYRSAYVPLRDRQGALLAYVNLPSFARQGETDQERGTLVTAVANLFVLLLALSLLAGVFISQWTTRPLEMLKRGLSRIALTGANEPIHYAGRDEVGELVRVYNRKVNELQASAERLAAVNARAPGRKWRDRSRTRSRTR
jgi:HAMP domain-containing protein